MIKRNKTLFTFLVFISIGAHIWVLFRLGHILGFYFDWGTFLVFISIGAHFWVLFRLGHIFGFYFDWGTFLVFISIGPQFSALSCKYCICLVGMEMGSNKNKTGLQPVSRPVEQILGFYPKDLSAKMCSKNICAPFCGLVNDCIENFAKMKNKCYTRFLKHCFKLFGD